MICFRNGQINAVVYCEPRFKHFFKCQKPKCAPSRVLRCGVVIKPFTRGMAEKIAVPLFFFHFQSLARQIQKSRSYF